MADNTAITARMARSNVPVHTFETTLAKAGQSRLARIIETRAFQSESVNTSFTVKQPAKPRPTTVSKVCALAAKELVLLNVLTAYAPLSFVVSWCMPDRTTYEGIGRGYIVVADLGSNIEAFSPVEWLRSQDLLLHHINRGGGLILGDNGWIEAGQCSAEFSDALQHFEEIAVE